MWDNFFEKFWSVLTKFHMQLLSGLGNTLIIAFSAFAIGIVLGTVIAIIKVKPKYNNWFLKIVDKLCDVYVTVVRGTPIVVQLLLMYFGLLAQSALTRSNEGTLFIAILVFGLNSAAYQSEFIRAAIMSIDKGQMKAGRALGLSYNTTMLRVVIPQAAKNVVPTMGNEIITLLKDTSVAGYITVIDVTLAVQRIVARNYMTLVDYMILAVIYLIIVLILTLILKFIEKKLLSRDKDGKSVMRRKLLKREGK
ncbi:MAG: amino acid ABC transporter permease [Clostridia bacterium]|nr:amino acid ABC transporter permease [Clostridia bacterium]